MSGRNANGEGTVFQRKDGRWVAAVYAPTPDGGQRKINKYARTAPTPTASSARWSTASSGTCPSRCPSLTMESYLADWLQHIKQHVRPSTWRSYDLNTRLHIVPRIGRKRLTALTVRDVRLMIDRMKVDGVGARTIQYVHATIRAALEHAYREELVSRNVAKLVRVEKPSSAPRNLCRSPRLASCCPPTKFASAWKALIEHKAKQQVDGAPSVRRDVCNAGQPAGSIGHQ